MKKLTLLLLLVVPLLTNAQGIAKNAYSLLSTYVNNKQFSGNVLIAQKGKIVFQKAYGYADKEHNKLNTLQTQFRAGSLTKMFTSTLIMQLVEQGKIALNDPVSKYAANFKYGDKVTIKNLLSHTSGIRGNTSPGASTPVDMVNTFKSEPLGFTPGEQFEYNNFNYIMLAYIAQKVTGVPYPQLVKKHVFDKAGMVNSGIDYKGRTAPDVALGYMVDEKTNELARMETGNIDAASGAGALYTTLGDLLKWSQAIDEHKVLKASSFDLAFTPVQPGYGLGWTIRTEGNHVKTGHTGSIEGFMAEFMKFRNEDVTIIFLANLLPPADNHLSRALTQVAFNEPFEIETAKKEVLLPADVLNRYIGTYDMDGQKMVVSVTDGKLMVLAPGGDTVELGASAPNKFFVKGPQIGIEFLETNGKVTAMYVDMRGGQKFVKTQ
ncbi:serine hydrolase [Inquilinus sp. KBS0705]|nr:serine hydrolase [Inquilinus sp. KBS0705]